MAKIDRKLLEIFAEGAGNNGVFGSAQAGSPATDTDPEVIQSLAAWDTGWDAAVLTGAKLPALEEFQGLTYVSTYHIAYILQEGIPEYNADTEYHANSIVKEAGTFNLYGSITNNNQGNALSDAANWQLLGDLADLVSAGLELASQAEAEAGVNNTKYMSPLRVKQAIDALGGSQLLAAGVASGSAGVSFALPTGFKTFYLLMSNITVAAANTNMIIELERSSVAQSIDLTGHVVTNVTTGGFFTSSATDGLLHRANDLDNDAADQFNGVVEILNPRDAGVSTFYDAKTAVTVGAASPTAIYLNDVTGVVGGGANAGDDDTLVLKGDIANFSGTYALIGVK